MPPYLKLGSVPKKRHIAHRREGGYLNEGLYYEEVVTLAGFSRAYSIVYHLRPPTRVASIEPAGTVLLENAPQPVLRHHHLKSAALPRRGDTISGRVPLLFNDDVVLARCRPAQNQNTLFRNADADELIFLHKGAGTLRTMFGPLDVKPYDYIHIPRCTTYQLDLADPAQADLLIIESRGILEIPPRYLNPDGQLRLGAPFYERDLRGPSRLETIDQDSPTRVLVKDGHRLSNYTLEAHPFDLVGWDGFVYPFAFNADDFEPITGTVHQPPPVQQTFEAPGFVVCTFAPRMLDTHPDAIKVPYAHSNVHADEVLYYARGHFGSRRGVEEASLTLHPRGIPHGPHPGTILASMRMTRTDELAVMLDTEKPLHLSTAAMTLDDPTYPFSWNGA